MVEIKGKTKSRFKLENELDDWSNENTLGVKHDTLGIIFYK